MAPDSTPAPKPTTRQWLANGLPLVFIVLLALWVWVSRTLTIPRPPVGLYIGTLAFVAGVVSIWPPEHPWAKAAWFLVFGGFLVLEITTLYEQRHDDEATANANRQLEDAHFGDVLRQNQAQFEATLAKFKVLAGMSQESLDEATGGESYCYAEFVKGLAGPSQLTAVLLGKGRHPLSSVTVRVVDVDEMHRLSSIGQLSQATLNQYTGYFSEPHRYIGRIFSLYNIDDPAQQNQQTKHYSVFITALNGMFTETLLVHKQPNGSWLNAVQVTVSFYSQRRGLALEHIDQNFPAAILMANVDWKRNHTIGHIALRD